MTAIRQSKWLIPWIVGLALFLESLDATIITTAVPKIAANLQVSPLDLKVALTSYLLSIAIFIPISSWIAEKYGTRTVFLYAIAVFGVGSVACGFAVNLATLVLARVVQGMGGALMTPVARMVLIKVFKKAELLKVATYMTIPALIGPILGPVVGGAITTFLSWRWIFFINIPFVIAEIYFAKRFFFNLKARRLAKLDKLGFVLFALASLGFTLSFELLGEHYLRFDMELLILAIAIAGLIAFSLHAKYHKQTLFDLSLFQINTFKLAFLGNAVSRLGLGCMNFMLPLLFQLGLGLSPFHSGLLMLPLAVGLLAMKLYVKRIIQRFGFRKILLASTGLNMLSILSFILIDKTTRVFLISALLFLQGLISSLQYSGMNALVLAEVPNKKSNQASMMLSTVQQLGSSFSVGICALLLAMFIGNHDFQHLSDMSVYHQTFSVLALFILFAGAIFWQLDKAAGQIVSGHQAAEITRYK